MIPRGFEAEVGVSGDVEPDRATTSFTPACTGDGKMVLPAADSHWPKNGDHQPLTDRFHASMSPRLGGRSSPPAVSLPCVRREEQPCPTPARKVTVGEPRPVNGPITFVVYNPTWPDAFGHEATRIRNALGERALGIEHIGSTSVPGLAANPIIDILLVVADSVDQPSYVPALEAAGYVLRPREPDWHEHRLK